MIEKENEKARKKERNEFKTKVRELVEKLKGKDPRHRYYTIKKAQEKEEKRRKEEEEREAKKREKEEAKRQLREERAEYYRKLEEKAIENGEIEEVFVEEWRCEICKKTFKSEKQFEQHLQSKKHKDAEAKLRREVGVDEAMEQQIRQQEEERLREK